MDLTRLLRRALARTDQTAGAFAQSIDPPVSTSMLYAVARGAKSSPRVAAAIDELVAPERAADRAASVPGGALPQAA